MEKRWDDNSLLPVEVDFAPGDRYARSQRKFQGIPGIAATSNTNIWATWYSGGSGEGPDNYVTLAKSSDGGESWQEPVLIVDPKLKGVRASDPALWYDPERRLWLFWTQGWSPKMEKVWDGRAGVWCIVCDNPNEQELKWSKPRRIFDGVMLNKPCVCRDGRWIFPISIWPHEPLHPEMEGKRLANAVVSFDKGKSFEWLGGAEIEDRSHDEHHIYETSDGKLVLLARTKHYAAKSVSIDGGKTWPKAEPCDIPCPNSRFNITRLQSGRLLMVNHSPDASKLVVRKDMSLWLSEDDGETWQYEVLIDARVGVSYPDADQSPDGTIYVIYDYQRYIDLEILVAKFREEDLIAGREIKPSVIS